MKFSKTNRVVNKIDLVDGNYGGRIYEKAVVKALDRDYSVTQTIIYSNSLLFASIVMMRLFLMKLSSRTTFLLNEQTAVFAGLFSVNILLIHHLDATHSPFLSKIWQLINRFFIRYVISRKTHVVVVSDYWKRALHSYGFIHVEVIYNCVQIEDIKLSKKEMFNLLNLDTEIPAIYCGGYQEKKGAYDIIDNLADLPVQLIFSGESSRNDVCIRWFSKSEYYALLKHCDFVLLMSKFKEGWSRVAHEAVMLETPVVGSGSGGMKEVLVRSGQKVTADYDEVRSYILNREYEKTKVDMNWLLSMNEDNFSSKWNQLLKSVI